MKATAILLGCVLVLGGAWLAPTLAHGPMGPPPKGPPPVAAPPPISAPNQPPPPKPVSQRTGAAKAPGNAASAGAAGVGGARATSTRGGNGGSVSTMAPGPLGTGVALNTWEMWWEHNKESLVLRPDAAAERTRGGFSSSLTGRGRPTLATDDGRDAGREKIVPVLRSVLKAETDAEMCDSATLALARVATEDRASDVLADIRAGLLHETLSVRTSATLSLGVLGARQSLPLLNALMSDTSAGRQAVGGGAVPWNIRAYAALSLGLINDPLAIEPLTEVVLVGGDADRELRACAATALGLMHNDRSSEAVATLLECSRMHDIDPVVRACAVTSLARLGETTALPTLLKLFDHPRTEQVVRQSLALALGGLGSLHQAETLAALRRHIDDEPDAATRQFAWIALARIAAADTSAESVPACTDVLGVLAQGILNPQHLSDRPWAALAGGLVASTHGDLADPVRAALAETYADENDPSGKAALAIALGLAHATAQGDAILADLRASSDPAFRAYAAVGLGLLGRKDAAPDLLALCRAPGTTDSARQQLATAMALLRDEGAAPELLSELAVTDSLEYAFSVSRALGQIRDVRSIDPLVQLAGDTDQRIVSRAFACVALGLIGDKLTLRFNTELEQDYNYLAGATIIDEIVNL